MAWTVATKADVRSLYKLDNDDLQDKWSEWSESLLLEYLGKDSITDITSSTSFTEYLSGHDGSVLLTDYPIDTLTSVSVITNQTTESQSVTNYRAVGNELIATGSLTVPDEFDKFPSGYRNIKVVYESVVPAQDIYNLAICMMIAAIANYEGRKGADSDIEWGTLGNRFGGDTANENVGLVSHLNAILDQTIGKKGRVKIR